jgi:hypothetical protein
MAWLEERDPFRRLVMRALADLAEVAVQGHVQIGTARAFGAEE